MKTAPHLGRTTSAAPYVAGIKIRCNRPTVIGGHAHVADSNGGLRAIRVSDPAHLTEVGVYAPPGYARRVAVTGGYAYVTNISRDLRIVRISDPAHPAAVGFYDTPGCAQRVAVCGHYAYVADCESLRIVNVADPAHPTGACAAGVPADHLALALMGQGIQREFGQRRVGTSLPVVCRCYCSTSGWGSSAPISEYE